MPSVMNTVGWIADAFGHSVKQSGRYVSNMTKALFDGGTASVRKAHKRMLHNDAVDSFDEALVSIKKTEFNGGNLTDAMDYNKNVENFVKYKNFSSKIDLSDPSSQKGLKQVKGELRKHMRENNVIGMEGKIGLGVAAVGVGAHTADAVTPGNYVDAPLLPYI